ncbi:histone H2A-beta, sperm-like [Impatiens glandulifera]|uniref:histone H2A-beta, sperm-like n=1 Tax=Impatiens glandulifera TaxID=253017 RepID=UPI001FB130DD|nr:histone H2A-beta, sperm-like [Impatiens glandulifera]
MEDGSKSKRSLRKDGEKKKSISRSMKAGLQFPVGRIGRFLKQGRYGKRVGRGAPVYLEVVLEYLAAEVLELAGNATTDNKKSRITPRYLQLAVRNDEELGKLFAGVTSFLMVVSITSISLISSAMNLSLSPSSS